MCLKIDVESILRRKKEREREKHGRERERENVSGQEADVMVRPFWYFYPENIFFVRSLRGKN